MPWLMQFSNAGRSKIAVGQDVQRVEPAAGLADVLDDEVAREVVRRTSRRSRTGSAPGRTTSSPSRTTRRARRGRGASSTSRSGRRGSGGSARRRTAGAGRVPSVRGSRRSRARAARTSRRRRCRGYAGSSLFHTGTGRAPEPVAGDRPVAGVLQPLAELAVLDVVGHPVDLLVELEHPLLDRGHLDEPRRDALVDQRLAAAPAVRVGVVVGLAAQQHRARA